MSKNLIEVDLGLTHEVDLSSVLVPDDDTHVAFVSIEFMGEGFVPLRSLSSVFVDGGFVPVWSDNNLNEWIHLEEDEIGSVSQLSSNWPDQQGSAHPRCALWLYVHWLLNLLALVHTSVKTTSHWSVVAGIGWLDVRLSQDGGSLWHIPSLI